MRSSKNPVGRFPLMGLLFLLNCTEKFHDKNFFTDFKHRQIADGFSIRIVSQIYHESILMEKMCRDWSIDFVICCKFIPLEMAKSVKSP